MATIFPNIPDLPGVPSIPRSVNVPAVAEFILGSIQGQLWRSLEIQSGWGVFDSAGFPLADPALFIDASDIISGLLNPAVLSTGGIDFLRESIVSDFPVETGSFASYNKVQRPSVASVTLFMSGSESDRSNFLTAIDAASKTLELYDVASPEKTYTGYNIEAYRYSRHSEKGVTLLSVTLRLKEIREVAQAYIQVATEDGSPTASSPQQVDAQATQNVGKSQASTPRVSALKSLSEKIPALATDAQKYIQGVLQ